LPALWTKDKLTRGCLMLAAVLAFLQMCVAQSGLATVLRSPAPASAANRSAMLTVDQIVSAMMAHNESRAAALRGYTGRRVYHLRYRGFPRNKDGALIVEARYSAPATKQFTVVSQSGSKFIINKILKRLLTSEQEAQSADNRKETALTPRNYRFELQGEEVTDQGRFYILKVEPKVRNKFLYRGEIWVDASDFAVARIEAEPAKNPSFWISNTQIEQKYAKFGSFWLPVRNQSTSKVRFFGGTATLVIEYQDYKLSNDDQKAEAALTKIF
jgi:hypothetical protein